jgi:hypothetical protein
MQQYAPLFIKEELYKDVLGGLDMYTLEKMGIPAGHRIIIIEHCKALSGMSTLLLHIDLF